MNSRLYVWLLRLKGRRISMDGDPRGSFPHSEQEVAMSKLISVVVLLTAAGFAMAARGAPQSTAPPSDQAAATTAPTNHSPIKPGDRNCIRDTGSLIPAKKGECLPVTGRSYSKDDINKTGKTTVAGALQQLDPSVTIRGNGGN
jgi:hypothetical protein